MSEDFILTHYFLRPDLYPEGAEIMERFIEKLNARLDALTSSPTSENI
jgi:hypothetical protein